MFTAGQQIELLYPTQTDVMRVVDSPRRLRQLYVHRTRDLVAEPLTPHEFLRRPYVARSRWLILASEKQGQPPKQFYLGSADNFRSPGILRLALYEPGETRPAMWVGRQIEPTERDRRLLLRFINRVHDRYPEYDVRIVAPDARMVR